MICNIVDAVFALVIVIADSPVSFLFFTFVCARVHARVHVRPPDSRVDADVSHLNQPLIIRFGLLIRDDLAI